MTLPALGRPTRAEVDTDALRFNLRQVRKRVGDRVRILAVVKANAYGHGAVACSKVFASEGADALGVATVEEGEELRRAGITLPIVVLGLARPQEAGALVRWRLQPAVASLAVARVWARAAAARGRTLDVHVKVDTGMGRIGIPPGEAGTLARNLKRLRGLRLAGLFTHFAHADGGDSQWLHRQVAEFAEAWAETRSVWGPDILRHASNSAAVIEAPLTYLDMVRPGLMLYGLHPAERFRDRIRLRPALRWTSRIVQVKDVPARTGLSYGHTFVTRRASRIATLPVGYADGFSRAFSNRGRVLVRGKLCPIVGRVCMDMCLADVTDVERAREGEEAVLLGSQGKSEIPAGRLAQTLQTIPYEILCGIRERVPRIYRGRIR